MSAASTSIYKDIQTRTGGDIYIGVVGPVRTGKSTFIKRFMDSLVIPNIEDPSKKERTAPVCIGKNDHDHRAEIHSGKRR